MSDPIKYPVTKKTLHRYAADIFTPIGRGECVTTVWVPMAGRRMWNKFITENTQLFEKELPGYQKYLLVYIEPLDLTEESLAGYLRLMAKSLIEKCQKHSGCSDSLSNDMVEVFNTDKSSYSQVLDNLKKLLIEIIKKDMEVVFFIGEFDELTFANKIFYNNLKSLWSSLHPNLHYVFLMRERVTRKENIAIWGELNETILQNIVYVPLGSDEDTDFWINTFSEAYSLPISKWQKDVLKEICGGHPYLLKVAIRILNNHRELLNYKEEMEKHILNYYELISVTRGIFNILGEAERECIKHVTSNKKVDEVKYGDSLNFLLSMRYLIKNGDGYLQLFSKIFNQTVSSEHVYAETKDSADDKSGQLLKIDKETGEVLYNGNNIEEKFTRQEYLVLCTFIKLAGKLLTRDDIGEVLWGKDSYEKYSDWAIDQLISKLRKKLQDLGSGHQVVTIRGKGYKLINSAN